MSAAAKMADKFQVANGKNDGWPICFGCDAQGRDWGIITKHVQGGELHSLSDGADGDASLVCAMLNLYYGNAEFAAAVKAVLDQPP